MFQYDDTWIESLYYVISNVQSNRNYAAIETEFFEGIGILLWQGSKSYNLLKKFYDDNPSLFTEQSLIDSMNGNEWARRKFT